MDAEEISLEELKEKLEKGKVQLIDVMPAEFFKQQHIKGAKNIPLIELREHLEELDKEKETVLYCKDYACHSSRTGVKILKQAGFEKVKKFPGGLKAWQEAGLEVESYSKLL